MDATFFFWLAVVCFTMAAILMLTYFYDAICIIQKRKDIGKVRKWICNNCECSGNCEFDSPDNCPTIKSITKAMEEE